MMASLCQESGRQKAGNGLESRKGSRVACGGERQEKGYARNHTGCGATSRYLPYTWGFSQKHQQKHEEELQEKGVIVTCSTVSGEQISSPLRIMERWVNTSESWKESRPSSSLTLLTTENTQRSTSAAVERNTGALGDCDWCQTADVTSRLWSYKRKFYSLWQDFNAVQAL